VQRHDGTAASTALVTRSASRYRRNFRTGGTHEVILGFVPPGSRVLDVGCGTGYLGEALAARGCLVWGIDVDLEAVRAARPYYEDVAALDLDRVDRLPWPTTRFDVILAADVLEHLRYPSRTLRLLRCHLEPEGRLIVSLPNVAHLSVRVPLLFGRFRYRETGILDRTHLSLYTFETARELVESGGFRVESALVGSDHFGRILNRSRLLRRCLRGALAYNFVLLCNRAPV